MKEGERRGAAAEKRTILPSVEQGEGGAGYRWTETCKTGEEKEHYRDSADTETKGRQEKKRYCLLSGEREARTDRRRDA